MNNSMGPDGTNPQVLMEQVYVILGDNLREFMESGGEG